MTRAAPTLAVFALWATVGGAAPESADPSPFQSGEVLRYEVVWPSGLTLGEAEFRAQAQTGAWAFEADLTASLPNFEIEEHHRAVADAGLCSQELTKKSKRGDRKTNEVVTFNQTAGTAKRETEGGGGVSTLDIPPCVRDALTYLYYLRQDLAKGRIPPPDDLNFGAQYAVTVTYAETRRVEAAGKSWDSDRILIDLAGPDSAHSFEVFFSKDASRKPLIVRVPFELGTFSLRLVE